MQARSLASSLPLLLPLSLLSSLGPLACQAEPAADRGASDAAANTEPGRAPQAEPEPVAEPAPEPAPEPEPEPATEPEPELDADPVMAERKQALADVGRAAFAALQSGTFADLVALTPLDAGRLQDACKRMPLSKRAELEARFAHCHKTIPWDQVAEAQVFAGKPTGAPATGCDPDYEDYGRLQLFVHLDGGTIWRVEFYGAVGQDGNVVGINGEVACKQVDKAPKMRGY